MYVERKPNVDNSLVFKVWPFYLIYLNIIDVIFAITSSVPFYFLKKKINKIGLYDHKYKKFNRYSFKSLW
ncbi:MAG: hypothetical protein CMD36_00650 [Flavobacteriales bacterium]|nr:hypothetical protein [Flavobacteriales bacterium]